MRNHVSDIINETIPGGLRTNQRSTPIQSLARQHSLESISVFLVCAKEVSDFTTTNANIAGWDIGIRADMPAQFTPELSTEFADFVVGFAFGVKVGATLAASHHKTGQSVLENLFEAEELEDGEIDGGMEAETTLVGTEGGIELNCVNWRIK